MHLNQSLSTRSWVHFKKTFRKLDRSRSLRSELVFFSRKTCCINSYILHLSIFKLPSNSFTNFGFHAAHSTAHPPPGVGGKPIPLHPFTAEAWKLFESLTAISKNEQDLVETKVLPALGCTMFVANSDSSFEIICILKPDRTVSRSQMAMNHFNTIFTII